MRIRPESPSFGCCLAAILLPCCQSRLDELAPPLGSASVFDGGLEPDASVAVSSPDAGDPATDVGACSTGTFATSPEAPCVAHTDCTAGEYVERDGDATRDRSCQSCEDGSFTLETNAEACAPWSQCPAGSYVAQPGTEASNQVCAGCPSGTHSDQADQSECVVWTVCQPGEYVQTEGGATSDQSCADCVEGEFSETENATRCVSSDECPPGTEQIAPGSAESPPECEACSPGTYCDGGNAGASPCADDAWDHDADSATPCVALTECLAGSRVESPGTATTDRSCSSCEAGTFSATDNAEACEAWTSCGPGTFLQMEGSATGDRECSECASGTFSETENVTGCRSWTVCPAPSSYQAEAPNLQSDRSCAACTPPAASSEDNSLECDIQAFQMVSGQVVMEAENFHMNDANGSSDAWTEINDGSVSGGVAMALGPEDGSSWTDDIAATAPRLVYYANFTSTGSFYVHIRGDAGATTEDSDSCHAGIDDVPIVAIYDFNNLSNRWGWISQQVNVDDSAIHTVTIWGREDGFRVDKIVINTSATAPTGNGPAESARD